MPKATFPLIICLALCGLAGCSLEGHLLCPYYGPENAKVLWSQTGPVMLNELPFSSQESKLLMPLDFDASCDIWPATAVGAVNSSERDHYSASAASL